MSSYTKYFWQRKYITYIPRNYPVIPGYVRSRPRAQLQPQSEFRPFLERIQHERGPHRVRLHRDSRDTRGNIIDVTRLINMENHLWIFTDLLRFFGENRAGKTTGKISPQINEKSILVEIRVYKATLGGNEKNVPYSHWLSREFEIINSMTL